jgi:hypothetical protein
VTPRLVAVAGLVALVFAAPAAAKTTTLTGKVGGDEDGTVTMQVVIKHRVPVRLKNVRVANLDYACPTGEAGEISARVGSFSLHPGQPVGYYRFNGARPHAWGDFNMSGYVDELGEKAGGNLYYNVDLPARVNCSTGVAGVDGTFKAK